MVYMDPLKMDLICINKGGEGGLGRRGGSVFLTFKGALKGSVFLMLRFLNGESRLYLM